LNQTLPAVAGLARINQPARRGGRKKWKFKCEGDDIAPFVTPQGKQAKQPATAGRRER
jgi:hypothetical protein